MDNYGDMCIKDKAFRLIDLDYMALNKANRGNRQKSVKTFHVKELVTFLVK